MLQSEKWTILTERLRLRPFQMADAPEVARLCNNYNLSKGTLSLPYPYPVAAARGWIAAQPENFDLERCFEFAITDRGSGALYGCVSLTNHSAHRNGELGYWVGEEYWGRGIATEAAGALTRWAFETRGYHRIYARHFASNPASGRVMEKIGMTCEGTQKQHLMKNGIFEDVVLYGLLVSDANAHGSSE